MSRARSVAVNAPAGAYHSVGRLVLVIFSFFFSSRRRHTRWPRDWSSDVCSSDLSYLKVLGVIENMSSFTCEHGSTYTLFGEGGGQALAADIGVPLIGQVPLEPAVSAANDEIGRASCRERV